MTLEEYVLAGGQTLIYYGGVTPPAPDGYYWKLFTFGGNPVCYKLTENPKQSPCNCHK